MFPFSIHGEEREINDFFGEAFLNLYAYSQLRLRYSIVLMAYLMMWKAAGLNIGCDVCSS